MYRRWIERIKQLCNQPYKLTGWWRSLFGYILAFGFLVDFGSFSGPVDFFIHEFFAVPRDLGSANENWTGRLLYNIQRVLEFWEIQYCIERDYMLLRISMVQRQCHISDDFNGPHQVHLFMALMSVVKKNFYESTYLEL